jgi:hypothetical protein
MRKRCKSSQSKTEAECEEDKRCLYLKNRLAVLWGKDWLCCVKACETPSPHIRFQKRTNNRSECDCPGGCHRQRDSDLALMRLQGAGLCQNSPTLEPSSAGKTGRGVGSLLVQRMLQAD